MKNEGVIAGEARSGVLGEVERGRLPQKPEAEDEPPWECVECGARGFNCESWCRHFGGGQFGRVWRP